MNVRSVQPLRIPAASTKPALRFGSIPEPYVPRTAENARARLLAEIQEQPAVLARMLEEFPANFDRVRVQTIVPSKIVGIAEGSSLNALRIAQPKLEEWTDWDFSFKETDAVPKSANGRFRYFLAVSQSGNTGAVLKAVEELEEARKLPKENFPMLAFTNNPDSTMGKRYGNCFDLGAGEERSIAATKSMTASLMATLLWGLYTGQKKDKNRTQVFQNELGALKTVPSDLKRMLESKKVQRNLQGFAERLRQYRQQTNQMVLLSQGPMADILPEAGLKLTETSRKFVHTNNMESFKHGPRVMLGSQPFTIYVVPPNLSKGQADKFFADVRSHFYMGDSMVFSPNQVSFIRFQNSPEIPQSLKEDLKMTPGDAYRVMTLPPVNSMFSAQFCGLAAFQLLSAELSNYPNDTALQKVVT
jgi:glucosamine--fructose-6-phosphate aminotransferase (isomerizing)